MLIPTTRELEFLASLRTCWSRLYWHELARLLKENDAGYDNPTKPIPSPRNPGIPAHAGAKRSH